MKTFKRTIMASSTVIVALILACVTDTTDPDGGGLNNENRACHIGTTTGWDNNGLAIDVAKPPCPIPVVSQFSNVAFDAIIDVPSSKIEVNTFGEPDSYVNADDWSVYSGSRIGGADFVYFQQDPGSQSNFRAEPQFTAAPGMFPSPDTSTKLYDSLRVDAYALLYGNAAAWKWLPGRIDPNASVILGTSTFAYGSAQTWRNEPSWDTSAYTFRWLLNGQPIAGAIGARYYSGLGPAGTYNLSTIATRADNSADTVSMAVTVQLAAQISGPTSPIIGCLDYWSGSASGGTAPYTYYWTANGVQVGGSTEELQYTPTGPRLILNVTATDATGKTGSGTLSARPVTGSC
jgi:hypothetical protein